MYIPPHILPATPPPAHLVRRADKVNIVIAVVVSILLALFFVGLGAFIWFYGPSIQVTHRRSRRRGSHSHGHRNKEARGSAEAAEPVVVEPPP